MLYKLTRLQKQFNTQRLILGYSDLAAFFDFRCSGFSIFATCFWVFFYSCMFYSVFKIRIFSKYFQPWITFGSIRTALWRRSGQQKMLELCIMNILSAITCLCKLVNSKFRLSVLFFLVRFLLTSCAFLLLRRYEAAYYF